jgi:hypothetical protein
VGNDQTLHSFVPHIHWKFQQNPLTNLGQNAKIHMKGEDGEQVPQTMRQRDGRGR